MSVNQDLFDAEILHAHRIQFLSNGIVKRMLALLAASDAELTVELRQKIESLEGTAFSIERIERQLASIYALNQSIYGELSTELNKELTAFNNYEVEFQYKLHERILPAQIAFDTVNLTQVYAAAQSMPFSGRLLSEWMSDIEDNTAKRIRDAVRLGVIQGETTDQIVRRIRGTRALKYTDGLLNISKKDATAVVRTAVAHTQSFARKSIYEANQDLLKGEEWVATLDSRTCPQCAENDGRIYEVGKGEYPPIHMNDRCVRVAVFKSWRELGFDVDELPPSTRASMDGQVPEDTTFSTWLKKQSASRQDEVLGKERGRIYRESGAPLERFINREGKYYTLDELKQLEL